MTGKSSVEIAVIKSIKLGGYEFGGRPIMLSTAKKGLTAADNYLGLLGNELISRFNFILDYSNNILFLKPNQSYHRKTDFPVSGIDLVSKNGEILISDVVSTSSAYMKGLRRGQKILAINNIKKGSLEEYRQILNSSEGTIVEIEYLTKAGVKMQAKIKLKRLI
jgi:predicted metalloprotease with PDZ domain